MYKKLTSFFVIVNLAIFGIFLADFRYIYATENVKINPKSGVDEILVKFKGIKELSSIKIEEKDLDKILIDLSRNNFVEYAEPNYKYKASMVTSDSNISEQWYLKKIKAFDGWDIVRESPNAIIAILDSGVQISHPDLRDNIWSNEQEIPGNNVDDDNNGFIDDINGWDFVNNVPDPGPKFKPGFTDAGINHGTVIAGIIGASGNNATGISGVTWRSKMMPLKVLDDKGEGNTGSVIKAIDYAINNKVNIINFSFVGFGYSKSLDEAIKRAYDAGIVLVAAAGNESDNGEGYSLDKVPMYPACHDGALGENRVIGVTATDSLDQKAPFSSYGNKCVDIAAPGVSFYSTVVYDPSKQFSGKTFSKYYEGYWSGTSMATPIISASVALIEASNPSFNRKQVIATLLNTSDDISKLNPLHVDQLGKGRVNVFSAIATSRDTLSHEVIKIIVSQSGKSKSLVKIIEPDGKLISEFNAFDDKYQDGINLASGDVDGDGKTEIIVAQTMTGGLIKVFSIDGKTKAQFKPFEKDYKYGTNIAVGDLDGDHFYDIIATKNNNAKEIKIFSGRGVLKKTFKPYNFSIPGGMNLASGDIDGDNLDEIVIAPGTGGGPQVTVLKYNNRIISRFFAYNKAFRGGVRLAIGCVDGNCKYGEEIITAPGPGGSPHIRIFNNRAKLINEFFAYGDKYNGGVAIAANDFDRDGLSEIVTSTGLNSPPYVRIFKNSKNFINSFYVFNADGYNSGLSLSTLLYK